MTTLTSKLTDIGVNVLSDAIASTTPAKLTKFKIAEDSNITLDQTATDVVGLVVHNGTVAEMEYDITSNNQAIIRIILDESLGPFDIGNLGLFTDDDELVVIATFDETLSKTANAPGIVGDRLVFNIPITFTNIGEAVDFTLISGTFASWPFVQTIADLPDANLAPFEGYIVREDSSQGKPITAIRNEDPPLSGSFVWALDYHNIIDFGTSKVEVEGENAATSVTVNGVKTLKIDEGILRLFNSSSGVSDSDGLKIELSAGDLLIDNQETGLIAIKQSGSNKIIVSSSGEVVLQGTVFNSNTSLNVHAIGEEGLIAKLYGRSSDGLSSLSLSSFSGTDNLLISSDDGSSEIDSLNFLEVLINSSRTIKIDTNTLQVGPSNSDSFSITQSSNTSVLKNLHSSDLIHIDSLVKFTSGKRLIFENGDNDPTFIRLVQLGVDNHELQIVVGDNFAGLPTYDLIGFGTSDDELTGTIDNYILKLMSFGQAQFTDGTVGQPSVSFINDDLSGLFKNGSYVSISATGSEAAKFGASDIQLLKNILMGSGNTLTLIGSSAQILNVNGDNINPAYSFASSTNTGFNLDASDGIKLYRAGISRVDLANSTNNILIKDPSGNNSFRISVNGQVRLYTNGTNALPTIAWETDADTGLYYEAALESVNISSAGSVIAKFTNSNGLMCFNGLRVGSSNTTIQQINGFTRMYTGVVDENGIAISLPSGWSCSRSDAGDYTITHNLGTTNIGVIATASGLDSDGGRMIRENRNLRTSNAVFLRLDNDNGTDEDEDFYFMIWTY